VRCNIIVKKPDPKVWLFGFRIPNTINGADPNSRFFGNFLYIEHTIFVAKYGQC
jgi:hypothetical protein